MTVLPAILIRFLWLCNAVWSAASAESVTPQCEVTVCPPSHHHHHHPRSHNQLGKRTTLRAVALVLCKCWLPAGGGGMRWRNYRSDATGPICKSGFCKMCLLVWEALHWVPSTWHVRVLCAASPVFLPMFVQMSWVRAAAVCVSSSVNVLEELLCGCDMVLERALLHCSMKWCKKLPKWRWGTCSAGERAGRSNRYVFF
jgi:hypothetical protein